MKTMISGLLFLTITACGGSIEPADFDCDFSAGEEQLLETNFVRSNSDCSEDIGTVKLYQIETNGKIPQHNDRVCFFSDLDPEPVFVGLVNTNNIIGNSLGSIVDKETGECISVSNIYGAGDSKTARVAF